MQPSAELDLNLSDGVVAEKVFIEEFESDAEHSQEVLDEDDAFLGSASPEVWEYEVVDARAAEFEDAIKNSDLVLESDIVDLTVTLAEDATGARPGLTNVYPGSAGNGSGQPSRDGSGVRSGDDGPAGMPTGDASAGGLNRGASAQDLTEEGMEGLDLMDENDPRLGLTNIEGKPSQDWAANTGPTRNPGRNPPTR